MDLFEHYETLPKEVAKIYWKYSEIGASEGFDYDVCAEYLKEMNAVGYTFEYGLDAEPINLKKLNNNMKKVIKLNVFGIVVTLIDGGGSITSTDLQTEHRDEEDELYNAAMDGIESMILAHACAGIDITTPAYIEGIETAVNACANNY